MRARPFGRNEPGRPEVSEIGLGTWQIGAGWGRVSEDDAMAVLHAAADAGIDFFDTADVYGRGRSETLIGRFLRDRPGERFFVATKIGLGKPLAGPETFDPRTLREHAMACLDRLGLDRHDLLQLHTVPREVLFAGEALDILRSFKDEGLTRFFGASVRTLDEAFFCLERGVDCLQVIFNVFRREAAEKLFAAARGKGAAVIARIPLASGLLAGKLHAGTTFAKTDHRRFNRDGRYFHVGETFAGLPFEKGLELAETWKSLRPKGMTPAQAALRFVLDHPDVTTVIPGARNARQAAANAAASDAPALPGELHARLREFYETDVAPHIRGER